jgi:hypothetical protein
VTIDLVSHREDMTMFKVKSHRIGCRLLLAAAVLAGLMPAARAQAQVSGPCAETVQQYCRDVTPGEGRIIKCLNEHRDDQSPFCKDWIADQQKSLKELNTACYEEIGKLCRYDSSDGLRIFQCLDYNYVALKLDCRNKLREIKDRLQ